MSARLAMRPVDPARNDWNRCDQCGAEVTFTAGVNPEGGCMMVMTRCTEHTPTLREMDAVRSLYR